MKLKWIMVFAVICLGVTGQAYSEEKGSTMEEKGSHMESMAEGEITGEVTETGAIKVGNTICPLSKEKVGAMGEIVEYEHEGKIYNFCCKMCLKDFKKTRKSILRLLMNPWPAKRPLSKLTKTNLRGWFEITIKYGKFISSRTSQVSTLSHCPVYQCIDFRNHKLSFQEGKFASDGGAYVYTRRT